MAGWRYVCTSPGPKETWHSRLLPPPLVHLPPPLVHLGPSHRGQYGQGWSVFFTKRGCARAHSAWPARPGRMIPQYRYYYDSLPTLQGYVDLQYHSLLPGNDCEKINTGILARSSSLGDAGKALPDLLNTRTLCLLFKAALAVSLLITAFWWCVRGLLDWIQAVKLLETMLALHCTTQLA